MNDHLFQNIYRPFKKENGDKTTTTTTKYYNQKVIQKKS